MHQFAAEQPYLLLFLALLLGGETVLVPAVYLALVGKLEIAPVVGVASVATILSDSVWFCVGRFLPFERLQRIRWLGKRWPQVLTSTSDLFRRHGLKLVFISKFLYGTRIAAQMLAGVTRLQFSRYLMVNAASVFVWLGLILVVGIGADKGAGTLSMGVHRAYFILGLFIPILLVGRVVARHLATRFLSMPHAEPGTTRSPVSTKAVSAIVPAFNEGETICDVIRVLEAHPLIDDITVVDDGSTDDTAERVRGTSATLISFPTNQGKAAAMAKGIELARHDLVFFLDADLQGLTPEIIDALINPVLSEQFDMFVAIRDRRQAFLNKIVYFSPILGGERVLRKSLWFQVPRWCVKSFQIEIALNYFSKRCGGRMGFALMPGLRHIKKETKRGFWPGVRARVSMYAELMAIAFKLYIVRSTLSIFSRRGAHQNLGWRQAVYPRS